MHNLYNIILGITFGFLGGMGKLTAMADNWCILLTNQNVGLLNTLYLGISGPNLTCHFYQQTGIQFGLLSKQLMLWGDLVF